MIWGRDNEEQQVSYEYLQKNICIKEAGGSEREPPVGGVGAGGVISPALYRISCRC